MIAPSNAVSSPRRRGITLVEILVVIAIIGVLSALAAWAAFAVIGGRQRDNTKATMQMLNKLLQDRWKFVIDEAKKEQPSPQVLMLAGGDMERAKVIWIKIRLSEAFPVAYKEMNPEVGVPPTTIVNLFIPPDKVKPHFKKYQDIMKNANVVYTAPTGPTESGALLLLALSTLQAGAGGVSVNDQLKSSIADTNHDGIPELVDGWGVSYAFFRFPWNNIDLQNSHPASTANKTYPDPVDPTGTLVNKEWYNLHPPHSSVMPRKQFEQEFHPVTWPFPHPAGQRLEGCYVIPVIVSAGRDGKLGLNADFSLNPAQDALDNIYSYHLNN
jgi:prepilin-type N-terminal cleavage/methylation domain-containing protein